MSGDFDNDGYSDLALYRRDCTNGSVWNVKSTRTMASIVGSHKFGGCGDIPVGYGGEIESAATQPVTADGRLGDFDGDGKKDIAALNGSGDGLWVHRNTSTSGTPSFAAGQSVSSGWSALDAIMIADVDSDGKDDIVGRFGDSLAVWRSTSTSTAFSFEYKAQGTGWNSYSKFVTTNSTL